MSKIVIELKDAGNGKSGKPQVSCECNVIAGNDELLTHAATYLGEQFQKTAKDHINSAFKYAVQQMKKRGIR
jgi:hypothetical protein